MQRRDILKLVPLAALIPSVASSKEELEKKLDGVEGKYLILADPSVLDFGSLFTDEWRESSILPKETEIWSARLVGHCEYPILIYKLT